MGLVYFKSTQIQSYLSIFNNICSYIKHMLSIIILTSLYFQFLY